MISDQQNYSYNHQSIQQQNPENEKDEPEFRTKSANSNFDRFQKLVINNSNSLQAPDIKKEKQNENENKKKSLVQKMLLSKKLNLNNKSSSIDNRLYYNQSESKEQ